MVRFCHFSLADLDRPASSIKLWLPDSLEMKRIRLRVSVIIPSWQQKDLLDHCLRSLETQTFKDFETVVVDNGSTDGTAELVTQKFPQTKLVKLERNLGFAAAVNRGIEKNSGEYFALLNNDMESGSDWLANLVKTLDDYPEFAACASKQLNFKDHLLVDAAGDELNIVGQARSRGHGEIDVGQYEKTEEVFAVSGGSSLYRRSVWRQVGPFAEEYFAYFEDLDWCFRARLQGFCFGYEPKAVVFHHHKATSSQDPAKLAYLTFRNTTMTMLVNFPREIFWRRWRWLKIPLVHLNTIWYLARAGQLGAALKADSWILAHLGWLRRRRSSIQKKRCLDPHVLENWMLEKPITFWGLRR